jgi:predicted amidohydrolase YtcJ
VDLRGASVIPGINDSHLHALMWSLGSPPFTLDVGHPSVTSIADIVEAVRIAASERPAGSWIVGWGWDQPYFAEGRAPTRADLDPVSPNHPVILTEFSGHAVWVNSKALELAGITRRTEASQGGIIVKDARGEPTGVLFESASAPVRRLLPPTSDADRARALAAVMPRMAAAGSTRITEPGLDRAGLEAYATLYRAGTGTARLTTLRAGGRSANALNGTLADMPALDGVDRRFMRLAGIKLFADGIPTNNKTAWLHDPYVGGGDGELVVQGGSDDERVAELHAMIRAAHEAGWQIGTHATGDRAIDAVVDGYIAAQSAAPRPDPRHYIIHADLTMPATLDRMAAAGIGANFNAAIKHLIADGQVASIGPERAGYEWPYRRALDAGVKVASSSDAPVTDANWGKGLAMCVARKGNQSGTVFGPEQRISLHEALATYTATGAWQDRAEDWKGRLIPGFAADLCVLDRSLPEVAPDELPAVGVAMTVVDGRVVHRTAG